MRKLTGKRYCYFDIVVIDDKNNKFDVIELKYGKDGKLKSNILGEVLTLPKNQKKER